MKQRSDAWFSARLGKVTASRIADVMAQGRSGEAVSRKNYRAELVAERLTGERAEGFTSAAMQHGIDTEPQARAAYEWDQGVEVVECGLINHPLIAMSAASPDGLVGDAGLVEIKCPNTATHIDLIETGKIDRKYLFQMQWQMACTERAWCDFVSFDPRLGEAGYWRIRVERDDKMIADISAEVTDFLAGVDAMESGLREKFGIARRDEHPQEAA